MFVYNPVNKQRLRPLKILKVEPVEETEPKSAEVTIVNNNDDSNLISLLSDDEVEVVEETVHPKNKEGTSNTDVSRSNVNTIVLEENCDNNENTSEPRTPEDDAIDPLKTYDPDLEVSDEYELQVFKELKFDKSTQTYDVDFPEKQRATSVARSEASVESITVAEENSKNNREKSSSSKRCSCRHTSLCLRPKPYPRFSNCSNQLPSDLANNEQIQNYINWRVRGLTRQYELRILQGFRRFMNFVTHINHQQSNHNISHNHGFNQQNTNSYGYSQQNTNNYRSDVRNDSNLESNQNTYGYESNQQNTNTYMPSSTFGSNGQDTNTYESSSTYEHSQNNTNNYRSDIQNENNLDSNENTSVYGSYQRNRYFNSSSNLYSRRDWD